MLYKCFRFQNYTRRGADIKARSFAKIEGLTRRRPRQRPPRQRVCRGPAEAAAPQRVVGGHELHDVPFV